MAEMGRTITVRDLEVLRKIESRTDTGGINDLMAYREECVREAVEAEREACAMLHESVPNECDRDLKRAWVTGCGCGAMGAVIAYRDAIRKRGQRG